MTRIKVKELSAGMELNDDVIDANGRFLLGKGCRIDARHIRAFNAWGIVSVDVVGDDSIARPESIEVEPAVHQAISAELKQRFGRNDMQNPFIRELYASVLNLNLQRYKGGA